MKAGTKRKQPHSAVLQTLLCGIVDPGRVGDCVFICVIVHACAYVCVCAQERVAGREEKGAKDPICVQLLMEVHLATLYLWPMKNAPVHLLAI